MIQYFKTGVAAAALNAGTGADNQRKTAMEGDTISKHRRSSKSQTSRRNFLYIILVIPVLIIGFINRVNAQTDTDTIVYILENAQSRKDVIVVKPISIGFRTNFDGFQTKITHIDHEYIHTIERTKKGREIPMRHKLSRVSYTLTFDENAKQELYPMEMSVHEFLSLPIYLGKDIVVFGTEINNLSHLEKMYPAIYDEYVKGKKSLKTGGTICIVGSFFFFTIITIPVGIVIYTPGWLIANKGKKKLHSVFEYYFHNNLDLEVCAKYGIIITPYNTSLNFNKQR